MKIKQLNTRFLKSGIASLLLIFSLLGATGTHGETIKITTGEYPPWTSRELAHGGFMNLVITRAFAEQGITVEYDYMPWKRALELVKLNKYAASSYWGYDPERKGNFIYSQNIQHEPIVFFYNDNKPLPKWESMAELKDLRFGATRGYTYTPGFWELAKQDVLRISIANDDVENLKKLIDGKVDVFPISKLTGKYLLKKHFKDSGMDKIKIDTKAINNSQDFLLFSGDWPGVESLINKFNAGLERLKSNGEMETLREEFFASCCN